MCRALRELRDELRVLVVGMRADHQHARRRAEPVDRTRPTQRRRAPELRVAARQRRSTADQNSNVRFDTPDPW